MSQLFDHLVRPSPFLILAFSHYQWCSPRSLEYRGQSLVILLATTCPVLLKSPNVHVTSLGKVGPQTLHTAQEEDLVILNIKYYYRKSSVQTIHLSIVNFSGRLEEVEDVFVLYAEVRGVSTLHIAVVILEGEYIAPRTQRTNSITAHCIRLLTSQSFNISVLIS